MEQDLIIDKNELYHHGILGMKWGVRRYQKKDGSLTKKGEARRNKDPIKKEEPTKKKKISEMDDNELKTYVSRMQTEKQAYELQNSLSALNPRKVSAGERFVKGLFGDVLGPAAKDAGKNLLTDFFKNKGKEYLGLTDKKDDPLEEIKKKAEKMEYLKKIALAEDYLNRRGNTP